MPDWIWTTAERVLELWRQFRGRPLNRAGLALILGAIALETDIVQLLVQLLAKGLNIQGVTFGETPHYVVALFVIAAVVLLLADRLVPETKQPPNQHDVQLFRQFRELYDDNVLYFLRTHDFGNGYEQHFFEVMNKLSSDWVGARYQFEDAELSEIWSKLFTANRSLLKMMAVNTTPEGRNLTWARPWWKGKNEIPDRVYDTMKEMNDLGTLLVGHIDELEAAARKKSISLGPPVRAVRQPKEEE